MATKTTITSLAILKVNWDTLHKDYVENFVPFVVECVRNAGADVVSLPELQAGMRAAFGLDLPLNPLRQILLRAAKHGYLRRESGVFVRDPARCAALDFAAIQQRVVRVHDNVVNALQDFAEKKHETKWTCDEAEAALLAFIAEQGLAFLYAEAERSPLVLEAPPSGAPFIVGSFLSASRSQNVHLLEDVETLIKGNLLANSLFLPDHGRLLQRFQKTRVYLDTSFLVFAAGYAGRDRQAPCDELVALLREYGADLYCFRGTFEEVRGILDACTGRIKHGRLRDAYGPTIEYFVQEGFKPSDVELLAARLPNKLASMGIRVDEKPPYERTFQIDESGFEKHLQREIHYHNPKALIHDVDCISAIGRLRRGQESYAVETCRAIFITTNWLLAKATRGFFQAESSPGAVGLCITDYALGNLLWLKNPTKAPDLPRKRLVAAAYAAMQPPEGLWKLYLAEIARLEESGRVSAEDYFLLRHSTAAKAALMDLTQGNESAFSEGTVAEVLAIAKENLRADLQRSLEDEKQRRRDAETRADELANSRAGLSARVAAISNAVAKGCARIVFAAALLALGAATLYSFPWTLPNLRAGWPRYFLAAAQAALFIYTLASIAWGTTVQGIAERLERVIKGWLDPAIRRSLGISVQDGSAIVSAKPAANDAFQGTAPGEIERPR